MERRLLQRELADTPEAVHSEMQDNLRNIALANRWLGGTTAVMRHLPRLIGMPPARQPIRILDLGTGGADIPIAIVEWARKQGLAVQILAVDSDADAAEIACRNAKRFPEIRVDVQDIRILPYQPRSFEFTICSQVIHHLDTPEVVAVLRTMCTLATQGMIVSDLHRRPFCMGVGWIGAHLVTNRLSRQDALVSFQNAFTPAELDELAVHAGLPCWTIHKHGPCRLVLEVDMRSLECRQRLGATCHVPAAG